MPDACLIQHEVNAAYVPCALAVLDVKIFVLYNVTTCLYHESHSIDYGFIDLIL